MQKQASLVQNLVNSHFGFEDLVLVAFDIESSGRSLTVGH